MGTGGGDEASGVPWLGPDDDATLLAALQALHRVADAVELRDPTTAGHAQRVASNARALATEIGFGPSAAEGLYWAGLLHDIGKVAVPERVLQKRGTLDRDEWAAIRRHPSTGASLIGTASPLFAQLASFIGAHHERWDGTGYPEGTSGQRIPLGGRILAAVDVFDALTSPRPYRTPVTQEEAALFVHDNAGRRFDPRVVTAFGRLHASGALVTAPGLERTDRRLFDLADDPQDQ